MYPTIEPDDVVGPARCIDHVVARLAGERPPAQEAAAAVRLSRPGAAGPGRCRPRPPRSPAGSTTAARAGASRAGSLLPALLVGDEAFAGVGAAAGAAGPALLVGDAEADGVAEVLRARAGRGLGLVLRRRRRRGGHERRRLPRPRAASGPAGCGARRSAAPRSGGPRCWGSDPPGVADREPLALGAAGAARSCRSGGGPGTGRSRSGRDRAPARAGRRGTSPASVAYSSRVPRRDEWVLPGAAGPQGGRSDRAALEGAAA